MNNWKTGVRIGVGFGVMILLTSILGVLAYVQLGEVDKASTRITTNALPGVSLMGRLQLAGVRRFALLQDYLNLSIRTSTLGKDAGAAEKNQRARLDEELAASSNETATLMAAYEKTIATPTNRELFQAISSARTPYKKSYTEVLNLTRTGKNKAALEMIGSTLQPLRKEYDEAIAAEVAFNKNYGDEASEQISGAVHRTSTDILFCLSLSIGIGIFISIFVTRSIATPLAQVVAHLAEIANGDLSKDATGSFQIRGDEIGMLARAQQTMIVGLRGMIKEISGGVQVLSSSSTELMSSSTHMTEGSRHASDKAHSVSAAAEEMSANIISVAAGMEETTTNLAHVATATEEMTSTIGEIAGNSEKARGITGEATRQAARITEQISQLGQAAREIGKVTETITEISSQTNLLALNATIEAARAGSAGKGFAVVATEIKALAQQTAAATEDIKARIASVQAATSGGIAEIGKVSQVIEEVSEIVGSIAAAIEQQSAATKDIARNIAQASTGVADANARVSETSQVSREIAKDIVDVDHAAGDMATDSDRVRTRAVQLTAVAEQLTLVVARFRA